MIKHTNRPTVKRQGYSLYFLVLQTKVWDAIRKPYNYRSATRGNLIQEGLV